MNRVGLVGTGPLGSAIARRLPHPPALLHHKRPERAAALATTIPGSQHAPSLDALLDALAPSSLLLFNLRTSSDVLTTLGELPTTSHRLAGHHVVNISSGSPDDGRAVRDALRGSGVASFVDGAYCGGPDKVASGSGALFLSCDAGPEAFQAWRSTLSALGRIVDAGPVGASRALDYGVVDLAFVSFLAYASNAAMLEAEGVPVDLFLQEARHRLAAVPDTLRSNDVRMRRSRSEESYLDRPTTKLDTLRSYWASRLPYMRERNFPDQLARFCISLLDEARGRDGRHGDADVTRLQEVVRFGPLQPGNDLDTA